MNKIRERLGWWLRTRADRIDPEHAFVMFTAGKARLRKGEGAYLDREHGGSIRKGYGLTLWYRRHEHDDFWDGYPNTRENR